MKKTKNILSVILALCMLSMLSPAALAAGGFTDVPDDAPYADAVLWASENVETVGKSDTSFAPDDTLSRAEAVTFLWRACGSPEPSGGDTAFTDLSGDAYTDAVKWAYETGVTNGTLTEITSGIKDGTEVLADMVERNAQVLKQ